MITISDIHETMASLPPRLLIHGLPGVGKTTLAAKFPKAIFIQTEDGTPGGLKIDTFGLLRSFNNVLSAIAVLAKEDHGYQTVIVDTVDRVEGLVWADVCQSNKWPSIEAPGYGKGYVVADEHWREFLTALDWLRRERTMNIVLLAHSAVETVNDPRAPAYTSYQLRLHKRARALVQEEMDGIFFLATDVHVISEDAGFAKKRNRADGGAMRYLHTEGRPAFIAKSRFELPAKIPCPRDFDAGPTGPLASTFPKAAPGISCAINAQ